jgi:hypothetical protein
MFSNYEMKFKDGIIYFSGNVNIQNFDEITSLAKEITGNPDLKIDSELGQRLGVTFIAASPERLLKLRKLHMTTH